VCIAGRDEQKLREKAKEWSCAYTISFEELCARSDVDAVIVATPNTLHYPVAMAALSHGKHVLIEYPMAQSLEEIDAINAQARRRGLKVQVGLTDRFEGAHLYFKKHLPELGRPVAVHGLVAFSAIWKWADDDRLLGDYFALANFHHIDQFVDLFGPAVWVSATLIKEKDAAGRNALMLGAAQIQFRNGVVAWSQFGMGTPGQFRWATYLLGTEGSLLHDMQAGEITHARRDPSSRRGAALDKVSREVFDAVADSKEVDLGGFIEAIVSDQPWALSGEAARHSHEICFACTESARIGRRVALSAPEACRAEACA
jgi:biliverdin reductase